AAAAGVTQSATTVVSEAICDGQAAGVDRVGLHQQHSAAVVGEAAVEHRATATGANSDEPIVDYTSADGQAEAVGIQDGAGLDGKTANRNVLVEARLVRHRLRGGWNSDGVRDTGQDMICPVAGVGPTGADRARPRA